MKTDENLVWTERKRKPLLKTVVMTVMETESIAPDGTEGNYIVMDAPDWVIVIPVVGADFLMVKQWRHGEQHLSIEFPGGVVEQGELPEKAAERELEEETGYSSEQLVHIGSINPNPALMTNHVHIFVAFNLKKGGGQHLDNDEYVDCMKIQQVEVNKRMGSQNYSHALMCSAFFLYRQYQDTQTKKREDIH